MRTCKSQRVSPKTLYLLHQMRFATYTLISHLYVLQVVWKYPSTIYIDTLLNPSSPFQEVSVIKWFKLSKIPFDLTDILVILEIFQSSTHANLDDKSYQQLIERAAVLETSFH